MKHFRFTLLLTIAGILWMTNARAGWEQLGVNIAESDAYGGQEISISDDGTIYAIFSDHRAGYLASTGFLFCKKWNGSSWELVGSTRRIAEGVQLRSDVKNLAVHNHENVYIAYDFSFYKFDGANWNNIPVPGERMTIQDISLDADNMPVLTLVNRIEYEDRKIRILKYTGSSWVTLFEENGLTSSSLPSSLNIGNFSVITNPALHLAYSSNNTQNLNLVSKNTASTPIWQTTIGKNEPARPVHVKSSFDLGSRILYLASKSPNGSSGLIIKIYTPNPSSPTNPTLITSVEVNDRGSFEFKAKNGVLHLLSRNIDGIVKYHKYNISRGVWEATEIISIRPNTGSITLTVDNSNNPIVGYCNEIGEFFVKRYLPESTPVTPADPITTRTPSKYPEIIRWKQGLLRITKISPTPNPENFRLDWDLQTDAIRYNILGSNDGKSFILIKSINVGKKTPTTLNMDKSTAFKYYKIQSLDKDNKLSESEMISNPEFAGKSEPTKPDPKPDPKPEPEPKIDPVKIRGKRINATR